MSDENFSNPVSHRHAAEKQTKAFPHGLSLLRKTGVVLLTGSLALPSLLTTWGHTLRYGTLTLLFCQGVGLALMTGKFRLWLPVTSALLPAAWYWPDTLHLLDLCGLYTLAIATPGFVFIRSLLPRHEPLITEFARRVHGPLRPDIMRYTYSLTWFWSLFFVTAFIAPLLLWAYGSDNAWQWPLNGGTLALAAFFLILEYGIRRLIIRDFEHASLRTSIDIFRKQFQ
jgi:uncharacterized membrane protein